MLRCFMPLLLAAFLCAESAVPADGPPKNSPWATTFPYGTATAHEPNFADTKLWPRLSGKEYFLKTTFPKTRVLVWSKPGQSADQNSPLNPLDPKNWIDQATGQPATALPDIDTDVVVPAADKLYVVDFQNAGHGADKWGKPFYARSVTVGANAKLYCSDAHTSGNIWVRRGGFFMADVTHHFKGGYHTFYRNENDRMTDNSYVCQYLKFMKSAKDISTEFFGHMHTVDEFQVETGTLIIGPDSVMEPGREAYPYIEKTAAIAIMDGGYLGKWNIDFHCCDLDLRGGVLQAGLPDRPISRSAHFRISYKNWTNAQTTLMRKTGDDDPRVPIKRDPGIRMAPGSAIRAFSTDFAVARLVISPVPKSYPMTFQRPAPGTSDYQNAMKDPVAKAYIDWVDSLPVGLDMQIAAGATIEGVEFNGFRKGGIMMPDPAAAKTWKNVFYGTNLAPQAELFSTGYGK